jgi:hypothetical protein
MIEQSFSDPKTLLRLRSGPLGAHIDGFTLKLSDNTLALIRLEPLIRQTRRFLNLLTQSRNTSAARRLKY